MGLKQKNWQLIYSINREDFGYKFAYILIPTAGILLSIHQYIYNRG
jgi:hypothetical protein